MKSAGNYSFNDVVANSSVRITGRNKDFVIEAGGKDWKATADVLVVTVAGPGATVIDEHDNEDSAPRMTLNVGGADARVTVAKDNSASISVTGGTTAVGAVGVGVLQGSGAVSVTGSLTAVLLGKGTVSDTDKAFANTYLVGNGKLLVAGTAVVAGVLKQGSVTFQSTARQGIASAEKGIPVTSDAPAAGGNIQVSSRGVQSLAPTGASDEQIVNQRLRGRAIP
jgi:hypothetical protein